MKITSEHLVANHRQENPESNENFWIHREILNSLTKETIDSAFEKGYYELKLLVNGIEIDPVFFNDVMKNLIKYIDTEAEILAEKKVAQVLERIKEKQFKLEQIIEKATEEIEKEFNVNINEEE